MMTKDVIATDSISLYKVETISSFSLAAVWSDSNINIGSIMVFITIVYLAVYLALLILKPVDPSNKYTDISNPLNIWATLIKSSV